MNTGSVARAMSGWNASNPPNAGATPRPPPKPRNGDRLWPMIDGEARQDLHLDAGAKGTREQNRDRALEHVEEPREQRQPRPEGPHRVGTAGTAAAHRARVGAAR